MKQKRVRVSVSMPREELAELDLWCERERRTRSELVEEAMLHYLSNQ
jgi:metal-responsive CopG/Arc/MetJ family transcriptional regulator